ncbi:MAG: hypothetical protein V7K41_28580 [Nostoc sp.]
MISEIHVGCVTPKANAPVNDLGALGYPITQHQSAQVGKPAHAAGFPTDT